MFSFSTFSKQDVRRFLSVREGETHIGQAIHGFNDLQTFSHPEVRFVLIGLPEDVGIRANRGIGGAQTTWEPFLKSFLNIQDTNFLKGNQFLLYGQLQPETPDTTTTEEPLEELRKKTQELDDLVFPLIQKIVSAGKIPVVIGGGHNNAFPILKGASLALHQAMNALNIDAHADFRALEGRHSGNSFSYAFQEGYLKRYFALGLHEAYNSKEMMNSIAAHSDIKYCFYEDIFLRGKINWEAAVESAINHVSHSKFGVEMDTDCIENVLSSAQTPVGISAREAMKVLYLAGRNPNAACLHIPETVFHRADGLENPMAGKLLSYLVQAFTKGVLERFPG